MEPKPVKEFLVQPNSLDIGPLRSVVVGDDHKRFVLQLDFGARPERAANFVAIGPGSGVKTE